MESWSYVSEEKGFASDEAISKTGIIGWQSKSPYSYGNNMVVSSSQEVSKNHEFMEMGFQEMTRKSLPSNSVSDVLSSKIDSSRIVNPFTAISNVFSIEDESSSKLSSSVVESNGRDLTLFDLKLGRFGDQREVQNPNSVKQAPNLCSAESCMPAKRVRVTGLSSQTPFCQVHGCKKDLSSSKDYHKRHKVCEVHSKTAKVIVNGIEQRFCQQCSRFHMLTEFDDGKRSCRKRLAGHNERRRKPHGIHSGRTGRLFQSYNGSAGGRVHGTLTSSFICQDILPSNIMLPQHYETNDWYRHIKLEDGADYSPQSATPIRYDHLHPKSIFPSYGFEKQCLSFQENGINSATGSNLNENNNRYPLDLAGSSFASRCFFQNTSMGNQHFPLFDAASTVQGLSEMSDSGRALSLLSSQSQNSRYSMSKVPENLLGVSPKGSTSGPSGVSNNFHTPEMNSAVENHVGHVMISDDHDALDFGFADGIFQGPGYVNAKDHISCEDEPTIDLLQLSSQLQRVEHQRHSMQVKQENDAFCGLRIT